MTVAELIELLQHYNKDIPVVTQHQPTNSKVESNQITRDEVDECFVMCGDYIDAEGNDKDGLFLLII